MTESNQKPVRYMDFIGGSRSSSTDPLISRPVAKKVAEKPVVKKESPAKVTVEKTSEKPMISRKPATSRDLYPTKKPEEKKPVKTTDKPVDNLAKKASDALAGRKSPDAPDGNSYSLSGKSPFLPNYTIDKRPLSSSVPEKKKEENFEKLSFLGVSETSDKPRKNVYEKKEDEKKGKKKEKKPVKIIDDSDKKSGLPLFVIIILTIILGAAVGAGVYFLLPK